MKVYIKGTENPKDYVESWEEDCNGFYIEITRSQLVTVLLGINKISRSPVMFNHNEEGYLELIVTKEE